MRILIMGGTGAMGSHLVGILAADPANELTVTTRKEFPSVENGCIRYVRGNAHDIGFVRSLVPVGEVGLHRGFYGLYARRIQGARGFLVVGMQTICFFEFGPGLCRIERTDRRNLAEVVGYRKR